ncbi:uncharacterized protein [Haliotis asinina]|uniref:uncharacterized protein n=1 Tax=Haliotis asinina TaxID=109174 RepID=UPI0035326F65
MRRPKRNNNNSSKSSSSSLSPAWARWLHHTYYDPKHPAGYGGWRGLWQAAVKQQAVGSQKGKSQKGKPQKGKSQKGKPPLTQHQVRQWLKTQDTYTLHKPARRSFSRDHYRVSGVDELWQADLSDLLAYQKENQGYRYLLCVIDVFSKMAWVQPMKSKTGTTLIEAFQRILKQAEGRVPSMLQTDKGTEFVNKPFQAFLKKQDIHFYTSQNPETKASVVERFQRTLKNRMWRYFTQHGTRHYLKALPQLMHAYNHRIHRTIGQRPVDVHPHNPYDEIQVLDHMERQKEERQKQRQQKQKHRQHQHSLLLPGTRVRLNKTKGTFDKGYLPNWTSELFTVDRVVKGRVPPVYRVKDDHGEVLQGNFYPEELQPIQKTDDVYKVDQVLKRRRRQKKDEVLVRWSGYPASFDSWIPAAHLVF